MSTFLHLCSKAASMSRTQNQAAADRLLVQPQIGALGPGGCRSGNKGAKCYLL